MTFLQNFQKEWLFPFKKSFEGTTRISKEHYSKEQPIPLSILQCYTNSTLRFYIINKEWGSGDQISGDLKLATDTNL